MVKDVRINYRRRCSYNTTSNKIRTIKTPGGRLVAQYVAKKARGPQCGDCHKRLAGIPCLRPKQYKNIAKSKRTVARAYGGSRCSGCVKDRIMRAFIIEEGKIVKKMLAEKLREAKNK
eukprot:CAMPEP_0116920946 /NCGR_PEP_ID=MMETSP0467-20121206/21328_1 /TAXON_ID=283647 /ORGANISM="Mesodinium pulex, Strain SPMC105" /LENGTH=117 /DNA_ID=CAMNT_0004598901 /DNA_START=41 /DNA_END=394 /DNA_ORIENTATION=+